MKTLSFLTLPIIIGFGILTTGCYTQMNVAYEWDQPKTSGASTFYSWDDEERSQKGYNWSETTQTPNPNYSNQKLFEVTGSTSVLGQHSDESVKLDESASMGIYYKDYDTERWYDEHYVESLSTTDYRDFIDEDSYSWGYDKGYDRGYDRGYRKGYRDGWYDDDFWSSWYAKRWWRFNVGWWGDHYGYYSPWSPATYWAWSGYYGGFSWGYYDPFYSSWNRYYGFNSYRYGYGSPYGYYRSFWGYSPYNTVVYVTNSSTTDQSTPLNGARRYGLSSSGVTSLTRSSSAGKNGTTRSSTQVNRTRWEDTPSRSTLSRSRVIDQRTLGRSTSRSTGRSTGSSVIRSNGSSSSSGSKSTVRSSGSSGSTGRSSTVRSSGSSSSRSSSAVKSSSSRASSSKSSSSTRSTGRTTRGGGS